jgi:antitoxin HigA-1
MADFPPTHPGEVLREDFLKPLGMSQYALAKALAVPEIRISEIVHAKRAVTPDTALRLARYFGTSAEFWLGMQTSYDLDLAQDRVGAKFEATVRPRAARTRLPPATKPSGRAMPTSSGHLIALPASYSSQAFWRRMRSAAAGGMVLEIPRLRPRSAPSNSRSHSAVWPGLRTLWFSGAGVLRPGGAGRPG